MISPRATSRVPADRADARLGFVAVPRIVAPVAAASAGLVVMLLVVAAFGFDAALVARTFVAAVAGSLDRLAATLLLTCPLLLTGLALALAFRCGVWNIGAEGQYLLGALAASWSGARLHGVPAGLAIPLVLVAGTAGGALWAGLAAALKHYRGVQEVLSTILLNFVAIQILAIAVRGPLVDPASADRDTSAPIAAAAELPLLHRPTGLHAGIVMAVVLAVMLAVFLNRTTWGFRTCVVGANPLAARFAGIPAPAVAFATFLASGALAGLAGAVELAGNTHYLTAPYGSNYGYTAIAVALLAQLSPLGVVPAAMFFAALETGARGLQKMPVEELRDFPTVLMFAAQGVVILVTVLLTRSRLASEGAAP